MEILITKITVKSQLLYRSLRELLTAKKEGASKSTETPSLKNQTLRFSQYYLQADIQRSEQHLSPLLF